MPRQFNDQRVQRAQKNRDADMTIDMDFASVPAYLLQTAETQTHATQTQNTTQRPYCATPAERRQAKLRRHRREEWLRIPPAELLKYFARLTKKQAQRELQILDRMNALREADEEQEFIRRHFRNLNNSPPPEQAPGGEGNTPTEIIEENQEDVVLEAEARRRFVNGEWEIQIPPRPESPVATVDLTVLETTPGPVEPSIPPLPTMPEVPLTEPASSLEPPQAPSPVLPPRPSTPQSVPKKPTVTIENDLEDSTPSRPVPGVNDPSPLILAMDANFSTTSQRPSSSGQGSLPQPAAACATATVSPTPSAFAWMPPRPTSSQPNSTTGASSAEQTWLSNPFGPSSFVPPPPPPTLEEECERAMMFWNDIVERVEHLPPRLTLFVPQETAHPATAPPPTAAELARRSLQPVSRHPDVVSPPHTPNPFAYKPKATTLRGPTKTRLTGQHRQEVRRRRYDLGNPSSSRNDPRNIRGTEENLAYRLQMESDLEELDRKRKLGGNPDDVVLSQTSPSKRRRGVWKAPTLDLSECMDWIDTPLPSALPSPSKFRSKALPTTTPRRASTPRNLEKRQEPPSSSRQRAFPSPPRRRYDTIQVHKRPSTSTFSRIQSGLASMYRLIVGS